MGVYLYGLSGANKVTVINMTANAVGTHFHAFRFVHRHTYYRTGLDADVKNEKAVKKALDKAQKVANDPLFQHLVIREKPEFGTPVYMLDNDRILWDDVTEFPGVIIGRLKKAGSRWHLKSALSMPTVEEISGFVIEEKLASSLDFVSSIKTYTHEIDVPCTVVNFDENNMPVSASKFNYGALYPMNVTSVWLNEDLVSIAKSYLNKEVTGKDRTVVMIPKLKKVLVWNE